MARLAARGYRIVEADNVRKAHGDFAGTDAERAAGYRGLLTDPEVDAIFFARGGWGASRVLDRLSPEEIAAHPKIHMGGSDLTALFAFIRARTGLVCFHGPMVAADFGRADPSPETEAAWGPLLRGETETFDFRPEQIVRPGAAAAPLAGGCLSLLVSLEGTPDAVATDGCVVFWEDVNEEIYRLDRMLTQWKRAGRFARAAGVIIGSLENIRRRGQPDADALFALLADHFGDAPYPVVRDWPSGHGRVNRALALGGPVVLDTSARRLEILRAVA